MRIPPVLIALAALAAPARTARAEPSDRELFYWGLAMAPPTYLLGVTLHEGSHALAGKLVGAQISEVHLFPPGRDPKAGKFRFGWVYAQGMRSRGDRIFFYLAPKLTDAVLLGGIAGLAFTDAWPDNRYAQLALAVFATGLWVDFAKDVVLFSKHNDVVKAFDLWCLTGWRQVPARIIYAGAVAGLSLVAVRGLQRTFGDDAPAAAPRIVPLAGASF
ncbi:MAG TPA: hypothetical protein VN253_22540 [Kofleriaceae bacterium]|nr:hypothetical protein [Kofleriaceae bacterium]